MKRPLLAVCLIVIAALLPANIRLFARAAKDGEAKPIAELRGQKLYRESLPQSSALALDQYENAFYFVADREIENWAFEILLAAEAAKTGRTREQVLQQEITDKVSVSDEDVRLRYRRAPGADQYPYPQVLDKLREALKLERFQELRTKWVQEKGREQGLRTYLPRPPRPWPGTGVIRSSLSAYEPPAIHTAPSRGPQDAPVVLEIYSDFLCPFSRKFAETVPALEAAYPGFLRVVFHQYPLPMHAGADQLAEASLCANEQGKFWEMHDALMKWEGAPDAARLAEVVTQAGGDAGSFSACFAERRYQKKIKQDIAQAPARGVQSTPTFFLNGRRGVGAMSAEQMKPLIEWFKKTEGDYPGKADGASAPSPSPRRPSAPPVDNRPVSFEAAWLAEGPSRGPADASVTLVEFVDYNCPYCQKGAQAVKALLDAHSSPVRHVSKQYPLAFHPNAEIGSVAALCADRQGKYWEFRDEIFGASWGKQTPEDLKAVASKVGLDRGKFDACLSDAAVLERVKKEFASGQAAGVQGTPTYFINGRRVVGADPVGLKKALEETAVPAGK